MPYSLWVLSPLIFLQMTHTSLFTDSHYHIFLMKYLWNGVVISIYTEITVPWWIYLMTKSYTMTGISSDSILIAIPTCFFFVFSHKSLSFSQWYRGFIWDERGNGGFYLFYMYKEWPLIFNIKYGSCTICPVSIHRLVVSACYLSPGLTKPTAVMLQSCKYVIIVAHQH